MYNEPNNLIRDLLLRAGIVLYRLGFARLILRLTRSRVRALLYHAVEDHESSYTQRLGVTVSPAMFDANLSYFTKYYNVIPIEQLGSSKLPDNPLVITFDDGYKSVYQNAYPLLRRYRLPATVYLITRAVENRLVWVNELNWAIVERRDRALQVCHEFPDLLGLESRRQIVGIVQNQFSPTNIQRLSDRLNAEIDFDPQHNLYASESDIEDMKSHNMSFGFHTRDHFNLSNCTEQDLQEQLNPGSIAELIDNSSFAYPFGYFDTKAIKGVSCSGYQRIMTVGNNNNRFSARHVDRTEVFSADPAVVFAKLEVVEPVIALLRGWMFNLRSTKQRLVALWSPGT